MKRKITSFLVSLAVAIGLWLYVVTVVSPESVSTFYSVPVSLQGMNILTERGFMITEGEEQTVNLTFTGNRSDLKKINKSNITLIADVTKIDSAGKQMLQYSYSLPGDIASNAVTVTNWDPKYITVTVEERVTKDIPLVVQYTGTVPSGFIADKENGVLDYSTINVTGPASVINHISQAIINVDLTGHTETFEETLKYTLCDENAEPVDSELVVTNVGEVRLGLSVLAVKEIPLKVSIEDGGGATESTSSISIEPQTIRISGNAQVLEKITEYNLGTIRLAEVPKDAEFTFPITLPEGVNNLSGVTEAMISVQFPELKVKEIVVKQIVSENVPEGMEVEILSQAVTVTLRGNKTEIDSITDKDITLHVDFSNAVEGMSTTKATVVVDSKYAHVGSMGTYSVSATLSVIDTAEEDDH